MKTGYAEAIDLIKGLNQVMQFHFETYNIDPSFPAEVANLKEEDLEVEETVLRKDFRDEKAFTIDCEDCKDMDDAVSVVRTSEGYRLSVHIADVAAYVPLGSKLDQIASYRATSMYLPNFTIPMLPKVLSNNCCSLNPNVSRNTLSVVTDLDKKGNVICYEITKGLIKSRVKGVYSEVNRLLSDCNEPQLIEKYKEVYDELLIMSELYRILRKERVEKGATVEDSNKPKISIWKHSVKLTPTKEGIAENMIEEFMILANRVVAEYLINNDLPAVFRVQEEKNHLAAYTPIRMHHAELALEDYSHFTSPIRRIADLKNHQIITMYLNGVGKEELHSIFDEQLIEVCERATKRSRTAKEVEEKCIHYCYEQYFRIHRNDRYSGRIIGFDKNNLPIVEISRYNIRIIGYSIINGDVGDRYTFRVGITNIKNRLYTNVVSRVVA